MTITTRSGKGSPLSYAEMDANLTQFDTKTRDGWSDNVIEMSMRGGPNDPTMQMFRNNIYLLTFSKALTNEVFGNWHINHDYAMGTALYPHVHWSTDSTEVGTVRWGIEYTIAKGHQQETFPATTTVYVEQTTTGTAYMHYVAEVGDANAIPGTNIEPDTFILCRIFRDSSHPNDTFTDQVFGIALDMHYQAQQMATPFKAPNFFTGP